MPDQSFDYEACLAACARGDALSLERLHQIEAPLMQAQCEKLLGDRSQAEDAVRESFILIWQQARRFTRSQGSARDWIHAIMRRHVEQRLQQPAKPGQRQDDTPATMAKAGPKLNASSGNAAPLPVSPATYNPPTKSYQPLLRKEAVPETNSVLPAPAAAGRPSPPAATAPGATDGSTKTDANSGKNISMKTGANSKKQAGSPSLQNARQTGGWNSVWFWRTLSLAFAVFAIAAVILAPARTPASADAASLLPAAEPTPTISQVAVLQAPGSTSTPGWILTVDSRQNLLLTPQVDIHVPDTASVYLWTHNEGEIQPRRLGLIDPTQALTLSAEAAGLVRPGQIFEMTQEPNTSAQPLEPNGPVLFIGRTVKLG